jgi:hypothetical protein
VDHRESERREEVAQASPTGVQERVGHVGGRPRPQDRRQRPRVVPVGERDRLDLGIVQHAEHLAKHRHLQRRHVTPGDHRQVGPNGRHQARVQACERPLPRRLVVRDRHPGRQALPGRPRGQHDHHVVAELREHVDRMVQQRAPVDRCDQLVGPEARGSTAGEHDAANARRHRPGASAVARTGSRTVP